jgi:DNA primase
VFDFVMKAEHVDFKEALHRLGGGLLSPAIAMPPKPVERTGESEYRQLSDAHFSLLTTAIEVYHASLMSNPIVLRYVTDRGLDGDTVRKFKLGFASTRLRRFLDFRGWSDELAADLGLIDEKGKEWFRGRLVFPEIREKVGVYLAGRTVPRVKGAMAPKAKYLFLSGVAKPIYGRDLVAGSRDVFVSEGIIDYLLMQQWGCPAVCTLGVYLKPEYVEFLDGFDRVFLVPNRDDAGRRMWKACKEAFGDRLYTVLVPEDMGDVGDLAMQAAGPRRVFQDMVDTAVRERL